MLIMLDSIIVLFYLVVHEAWAGKGVHVLLSKDGTYTLFYWDIEKTGPNKDLESEVSLRFKMIAFHSLMPSITV